ncbi:hypothetical protein NFI96_006661 [Prochilodus magdalenae]|nr:hypothetical protein NFI96_006661 [Prochilodus magdalenae]
MRDFLHIFIIINFLFNFIFSSALRVRRENMKVQITAKGHTIMLKFMPLNIDTKLEGYILGYGSSMFSKQFIQLPKNGEPYETEIEEVNLETPLHLVIGSVTPTSVLLSWGTLLKTPYTETNMDDCIEEGEFTVRYKENETSQQWNYQTCPTTSTIIENLKPDTPYEFGVRAGTDAISGDWSPPVIHTTADVDIHDLFQPKNQRKPQEPIIKAPQVFLPPVPVLHNITQSRPAPLLRRTGPPPIPRRALGSRFDTGDNSSVFSSVPVSDVDAMGKKRFVAPHVIYKTDKRPEEPCSVTHSLSFFPDEEVMNINVTGPPKSPPTNLTVVTVEGCPSFVILDWEKGDNETTEYEVTSSTKGPNGKPVSVQITDQTHTTVENLKPESSYEFTVTPKNELGSGPPSEPVTFNTESADPRVSEITTGKNAIWSSFPFKADSYSECNGRQYVKRTWYRKFVGIQLCNSLRYKIYLSDSLKGKFYNIGDQSGYGEDHCQFVDSFLDGRTGGPLPPDQLPSQEGYFRAVRQEPVKFGLIGGSSHINYVAWYECGIPIPGSW